MYLEAWQARHRVHYLGIDSQIGIRILRRGIWASVRQDSQLHLSLVALAKLKLLHAKQYVGVSLFEGSPFGAVTKGNGKGTHAFRGFPHLETSPAR